jgi:hypothetical protein
MNPMKTSQPFLTLTFYLTDVNLAQQEIEKHYLGECYAAKPHLTISGNY